MVLCLNLTAGFLFCLAPTSGHAALVGRWVADDWAGGANNWVDRVAGRIATVPDATRSPIKTLGVFPQRGSNFASGLVFDGMDDYFSVAAAQNPIVGQTSVTIAALIRTSQGASGADGFYWQYPGPLNGESAGQPNDWGLTYNAAGNAQGFFNYEITPAPAVSLIDDEPHTMILTWQDPTAFPGQGVARLYVDGVLVGSTAEPQDGGNGIVNAGFVIGSGALDLRRFFHGAIGELRFYDSIEDPAAVNAELQIDLLVSSNQDIGPGTLRQAVANASATATITFDPALSGQTITLIDGQMLINRSLTIDASALPGGITISGNNASRVFEIASGNTVVLDSITITGGKGANGAVGTTGQDGGTTQPGGRGDPGAPGASGGGILNQGTLTLNRVTLSGNAAGNGGRGGDGGPGLLQGPGGRGGNGGAGGAIYNSATGNLTILNSTITGNASGSGANGGSGTSSGDGGNGGSGGGIANAGILRLTQTTVTDNAGAARGSGGTGSASHGTGGGVRNTGTLNLTNTIVALNTAPGVGPDVSGSATTIGGVNFIGNPTGATGLGTAGVDYRTGDPMLAPLGNYGGPNHTRSPLDGSPVVDASSSGLATDQRGVARPRGASFDIGAVEAIWPVDVFGYARSAAPFAFEDISGSGTRVLANADDENFSAPLGFFFSFYGRSYSQVNFTPDGLITLGGTSTDFSNDDLTTAAPDGNFPSIAVLWDDWVTLTNGNPGADAVYYQMLGTPGDRRFILQWNNIFGHPTSPSGVTFQAILFETNGNILCQYLDVDSGNVRSNGAQATVGIRDTDGHLNGKNSQWSFNEAAITNGQAIVFRPVYVPAGPIELTGLTQLGNGSVQLAFTNFSGALFTVLGSTNVALPLSEWSDLGPAVESPSGSGQFQFTDPQAPNFPQRFYRVNSP